MKSSVDLAQLADDQVIGAAELATMLNTSPANIYKMCSSNPERLPQRLTVFGRRAAWRMGTCRQWLRQQG